MLQQDRIGVLSNPFGQESLTPWLRAYNTARPEDELVHTTTTKKFYFMRVLKMKDKIEIISNMNILWLDFWSLGLVFFFIFAYTNKNIFNPM